MQHMYQNLKWVTCMLWLLMAHVAYSQEKQPAVKGIIKNEKAEPMEGVSVLIENRTVLQLFPAYLVNRTC